MKKSILIQSVENKYKLEKYGVYQKTNHVNFNRKLNEKRELKMKFIKM